METAGRALNRPGGGTIDLRAGFEGWFEWPGDLLETGFAGPAGHRMNDAGWDGDVLPGLRRLLGQEPART